MSRVLATTVLASGVLDQWRELGPTLWVVAGVTAGAWLALFGVISAWLDPRRVGAGAATLELPGDESPAVVNLLTTDWDLGHAAVPATLLDLAARRHLSIDTLGDQTWVRLRQHRAPDGDTLRPYERMVLDHVRHLARSTADGAVPAEALTTGPEGEAAGWWKGFRSAVVNDARHRGLSRARWPSAAKAVLIVAAALVAASVALAMSTIGDDPDDPDDSPVTNAGWAGFVSFVSLTGVASSRSGERDTAAGRDAASRWLGVRDLLGDDPLFSEQPPAAVAIWDRHLAHGAALGVARGAVRALPLGAESDREAWSSVGGRWRVVRIRYPRFTPPGYGGHPAAVFLGGLLLTAFGLPFLPLVAVGGQTALEALDDPTGFGADLPSWVRLAVIAVAVYLAAMAALFSLAGGWMTVAGLGDLLVGRRPVEGRVLRHRRRGTEDKAVWYVAVDDGSADRIRAWKLGRHSGIRQGDHVRAQVSRWLRHPKGLVEVAPAGHQQHRPPAAAPTPPAATASASTASTAATAATPPPAPVPSLPGMPAMPGPLPQVAGLVVAAAAAATAAAGGGAPPPLPGDGAVSAAAGRRLVLDATAPAHPLAVGRASATFRGDGQALVQVAWIDPAALDALRSPHDGQPLTVPGLGDEAVRARVGGGLIARRGDRAVLVVAHLPDLDEAGRDAVTATVAGAALSALG